MSTFNTAKANNSGFSFGMENFKRFDEYVEIDLSPISFLVGKNGAGKSTLNKAIALTFENIYNLIECPKISEDADRRPLFILDSKLNTRLTVGDYSRACNTNDEDIEFTLYNWYGLKFEVSIGKTNHNLAVFNYLIISNDKQELHIDFVHKYAEFKFSDGTEQLRVDMVMRNQTYSAFDYIRIKLNNRLSLNDKNRPHRDIYENNSINVSFEKARSNLYQQDNVSSIKEFNDFVENIKDVVKYTMSNIHFIYAENRRPNALLNPNDEHSDYISWVFNRFYKSLAGSIEDINAFILKWLEKFDIAKNYRIDVVEGFYKVTFTIQDGKEINLCDLGTGQIQLVTLIFHIANIMKYDFVDPLGEKGNENMDTASPLIFIEEPGVNAHPNFQSLLADFFLDLWDGWDMRFIIETHSEYIIRKVQVLTAIGDKNNSISVPIKVYYFPNDDYPYDMELGNDGLFERKFGSGFYDEAAKSYFKMIDIKGSDSVKE